MCDVMFYAMQLCAKVAERDLKELGKPVLACR